MKKILSIFVLAFLFLGLATVSAATYTISFLEEDNFSNVDDTTGFSTGDYMSNLNTDTLSLISGDAKVKAIIEADRGNAKLTHRGTRGLGIFGDENDEVDDAERIAIKFDQPVKVQYLETRSMFNETIAEEGDIKFYLDGTKVGDDHMISSQTSGNGEWSEDYNLQVDKIVFYIKKNQPYTTYSEFAVAKLTVEIDKEAPVIEVIDSNPEYPTCNDDVRICTNLTDASGIDYAELRYHVDESPLRSGSPEMSLDSNGNYCVDLSSSSLVGEDNRTVFYTIYARDIFGNDVLSKELSFTYDCMDPVAVITGLTTCDEGTNITLSGADSHDTVDTDLEYSWTGVMSGYETSENPIVECIDGNSTSLVTLTVKDNVNRTDEEGETVTIFNVNPIANANGPYTVNEGSSVLLNGSYTDAGILDVNSSFDWDLDNDGFYNDSELEDPIFPCSEDGKYTVKLMVTDKDNGIGYDTAEIICENVAPVVNEITVNPTSIYEEEWTTLTATVSDVGADDHTLNYTINWGDDTIDSIGTTTGSISVAHQYMDDDEDDQYTITLTVIDTDEAEGSNTTVITVLNRIPWNLAIDVNGTPEVKDIEICFTGSATDVYEDSPLENFTWNFGDGSTASGSYICNAYSDIGVYTVTMTVTDKDGGVNSTTKNVTIYDYSIELAKGWNLISFPLVAEDDDTSVSTVFSSIADDVEVVWAYTYDVNSGQNVWTYHKVINGEFNENASLQNVVPGYGYYVKMINDSELFLNGEMDYQVGGEDNAPVMGIPPSVTLATDSWNLIGKYGLGDQYVGSALRSLTTPIELFEYYDIIYDKNNMNLGYGGMLKAKEGYWLKMKLVETQSDIEYAANYMNHELQLS